MGVIYDTKTLRMLQSLADAVKWLSNPDSDFQKNLDEILAAVDKQESQVAMVRDTRIDNQRILDEITEARQLARDEKEKLDEQVVAIEVEKQQMRDKEYQIRSLEGEVTKRHVEVTNKEREHQQFVQDQEKRLTEIADHIEARRAELDEREAAVAAKEDKLKEFASL